MDKLEQISEQIRESFDIRNKARDEALAGCRILTRHAAHAIRAIHRSEVEEAHTHLEEARKLAAGLRDSL
ncbi:MAG: haloacid dehalogenase, partial [Methanothrix sp.]